MKNTFEKLSTDEIEFLISAINRFGDGQHPYIDKTNYPHLTASYVKTVLNRNKLKNGLKSKFESLRVSVLGKLQ